MSGSMVVLPTFSISEMMKSMMKNENVHIDIQ